MSEMRHRLTDIKVQEVSVVDAAANNRRFLYLKAKDSKENAMPGAVGSEVVVGGDGKLTTQKATETAATPLKLVLTAKSKAALAKGLESVSALVKAELERVRGAEETATTDDVPAEVAEQMAKAANELVDALPPAQVEKAGLKQFTSTRLQQLQRVHESIGALLSGVTPPAAAQPAAPPAETTAEEVTKAATAAAGTLVTKLEAGFAKTLETVAKGMEGVTNAVNKQAERLERLEKARGPSNAGNEPTGGGARTSTKKSDPWGGNKDLAAERVRKRKDNQDAGPVLD